MSAEKVVLGFHAGTLLLDGASESFQAPTAFRWDERVLRWRAPACAYRQVVRELTRRNILFEDAARAYQEFDFPTKLLFEPRPYQQHSIEEWNRAGRSGVIILPTGAGKSLVAQIAIGETKRTTLVVVPTIDLMNQWYDLLLSCFQAEVGLIGGGYFETGALTVTTYASAFRFMERLGNQFGLIVFDECHHLPASVHRYAAEFSIAPFRLGLTATPERADGADQLLEKLIGPIVYRREAYEMAGGYLGEFGTVRLNGPTTHGETPGLKKRSANFRKILG